MKVSRDSVSLPGSPECGTIIIHYSFEGGVQGCRMLFSANFSGPEHRLPGTPYSGTARTCYLPDNTEGNEVLKLLEIAFQRRLTFTIGTSVTSGEVNTVIWYASNFVDA